MDNASMSFDWIFFAIVFPPVGLALWELVRTWNVPAPAVAPRTVTSKR